LVRQTAYKFKCQSERRVEEHTRLDHIRLAEISFYIKALEFFPVSKASVFGQPWKKMQWPLQPDASPGDG